MLFTVTSSHIGVCADVRWGHAPRTVRKLWPRRLFWSARSAYARTMDEPSAMPIEDAAAEAARRSVGPGAPAHRIGRRELVVHRRLAKRRQLFWIFCFNTNDADGEHRGGWDGSEGEHRKGHDDDAPFKAAPDRPSPTACSERVFVPRKGSSAPRCHAEHRCVEHRHADLAPLPQPPLLRHVQKMIFWGSSRFFGTSSAVV